MPGDPQELFAPFDNVDWETACDACKAPRAINRLYFASLDPLQEPSARVAQSLERVGALRSGHLWRCHVCGRPWYDPENGLCTSVEQSWLPILKRWDAQPLAATSAQALSMHEIRAVHWSSKAAALRIPCRVHRGQSWYDPALVILQNRPLLMWRNPAPDVLGLDEADDIAQTEFALPYELRNAASARPRRRWATRPTPRIGAKRSCP